jgi:hypothetical protein
MLADGLIGRGGISDDSKKAWFSLLFLPHAAQDAPPVSLTLVANGKNLKSEKFSLFLLDTFG